MSFTLCGNDICQYTIEIASDDLQHAAADLSAMICDRCGTAPLGHGAHRILLTTKDAVGTTVTATFEDGDLIIRAADGASMKKAVLCFWMEQIYHTVGDIALPADLAYSRDLAMTVFYSDYFTPVADTCCLDGLIAAHEAANAAGCKVFADYCAQYYICSTGKTATVKTDVEWGNARFTIDDSQVPPAERNDWIFQIDSDHIPYTLTSLTSLDRTQTALGITLPQKSLVTFRDDADLVYIRYGGNANNGTPKRDTVIVDTDGTIDPSAPLIWNFDQITSATVLPIDTDPRCISGGIFTTVANQAPSRYTYYDRGICVTRSHTLLKDIKHYIIGEGETGGPYSAFIQVENCANVTVERCVLTGHKTYQSPTTPMGSYDINGGGAISLTFRDCTQSNDITNSTYWGVFGSNFCKNIVYDGCTFSRFDAHQGVANATILNSTIGYMGANAIGFGTLRIENSKFYSSCIVNLRDDYGSTWEGDVIIRNCYFKPIRSSHRYLIRGKNEGGHDFGYTCYMPRTVTVEGLHVESEEQMYVYANLNPNCTDENYRPAYPHIATETVTVTGYTANGDTALQLSPNPYLFRDTKFNVK